ncbi:FAD-binding domain-containing protein [Thalassobaculum sp. OXR-137]|uniref:FAD-binding domain-containing protein n=1 Tax=Thalassobaculum sp. OXR-137 TaxID=3100173 RepID=UPI002AC8C5E5|nr:FAD-binding domain-containing protein [Thalassobaculum sp. OXR-137]WPZ36862.1 FAD-binding domain-containing protein [Thalassobaculum sp. OXR-137]
MIEVVWFKRDLRVMDHRPLAAAAATGRPVLPLYVVEPEWWRQPDMARRHWDFIAESLEELRGALADRAAPLVVREGEVVPVLDDLHRRYGISGLWSHEETGGAWTFARDRAVGAWARAAGIRWTELPQHGVLRRLRDRDGWAARWDRFMQEPVTPAPRTLLPVDGIEPGSIRPPTGIHFRDPPCPDRQPGGTRAATALLDSFLACRGESYQRGMSSPLTAEEACSRLSPHLAWGTLSMREAIQATWGRMASLRGLPRDEVGRWPGALRSFAGRLHWHCHFIQKLESEPEIEHRDLHPAYTGLRGFDERRHEAWARGYTGLPFVDACMRSLAATGWINFRMRAMLVSVSSYHLWNDWREPGLHLARLFTDYEPGIHWSQTQMQSGTTGINTARIYNPVKQGLDHDPAGTFVRRWVPELAQVPTPFIHAPWKLSPLERRDLALAYPDPVVEPVTAAREARARIWGVRGDTAFREAADAIQDRHGSRKSGLPFTGSGRRRATADDRQTRLDL